MQPVAPHDYTPQALGLELEQDFAESRGFPHSGAHAQAEDGGLAGIASSMVVPLPGAVSSLT